MFSSTMDFHSYQCPSVKLITSIAAPFSATDLTTQLTYVDLTPGTLATVVNNMAMKDSITVVAGPPYTSIYFKIPTVNAFMAVKDGMTSTAITDELYSLFEREYTVSLPCSMTTCPVLTVDCNPPFDWAPKQFSFLMGYSLGTENYIMPTVKDCLGRNMQPYGDKTTVKMAGGSTLDDTLEDAILLSNALTEPVPASGNLGGFTVSIAATKTDYIGSRVMRY